MRRPDEPDGIDKELRFHIDQRVADLVASGLSLDEARRRARLELGGVTQTREAVLDQSAWLFVNGFVKDLQLAIRTLRATPIVTIVALLSLALGIGANTAIFSLVDSVILRPLPVAAPARLVTVSTTMAVAQGWQWIWDYAVWDQIRRRPEMFDGSVAWSFERFNLAPHGEATFVDGLWVNGTFFSTLGVPAVVGRTFTDADDRRGGGPDGAVAIISFRFWQRYFGGAADAVGRTLSLDTVPFTIVGIAPATFFGPEVGRAFDIAVPIGAEPLIRGRETRLDQRNNPWLSIMGRLEAGQSRDAVTINLRSVQRQIWEATIQRSARPEYRQQYLAQSFELVPAPLGESTLRRGYGRALTAIMIVVALMLVIACANVANLMLARGAARRRELSLRLALGASPWHLVRQLLAESILLAAAGTAVGLMIAAWGSRLLVRQLSTPANTVLLDLSIDSRMLLFTIATGVATVVLFGAMPALKTSRVAPIDALKEHARGATGDGHARFSSGLVVVQVAVSLVLVVGAALFVRTFASLVTRPLGFEPDRVLLVMLDARRAVPPPERIATYERIRSALHAVPDVGDAAISMVTPVSGHGLGPRIDVSGGASVPGNVWGVNGMTNVISPGWFSTYGTPIIAGRDFTDTDTAAAPRVAIVNQMLVRKFLGGASPLGRTITMTNPGRSDSMEIVGVVADAVYMSVREVVPPAVYTPLAQFYFSPVVLGSVTASVRPKTGSPARLAKSVAAAVATVNPDVTLTSTPLSDQIDSSLMQERLVAMLSGFFGGLALLLAALGLYGVTSYAVTRRRIDLGIRMALGARPGAVIAHVLSRVSMLVGAGIVAGAVSSLWVSKLVASLLYGVEPRDSVTLVGAALTLAVVGAVAGWLPAWRASRIDPARVLRES